MKSEKEIREKISYHKSGAKIAFKKGEDISYRVQCGKLRVLEWVLGVEELKKWRGKWKNETK